jgi:ornithine decarboxylase
MEYVRLFTFLLSAPTFEEDELEGHRLAQIVGHVEKLGFKVVRARRSEDAELAIRTDAAIGCMIVDLGKKGLQGKNAKLISLVRQRGLEMPIVLLLRRQTLEDIPVDVLNDVDGYIFLAEETPEFIAKNLVSRLRQYAASLKTPFFGALIDYAQEGNQLWTCPGHNGGMFYSRSPIGRIFVEHLGEAVFRDDLDNSILELGDLLVHEGPALEAQRQAAQIFGAERTYFVLNGTSSSNKVVLSALVTEDDLVLFDRNNHKSNHHGALLIGRGVPVYLETERNAYGMVGPIDLAALDETRIREKIKANPLVKDPKAWQRERPFRVAVLQACSYDGTVHDAETILARIGHLCEYILFDEAWAGFMKFHPLYRGRYAMGLKDLGAAHPGIFATQSTHKQLASFSQASQIHVRDSHITGQRRRVEHRRFNEMFLVQASTSPFYPLFASIDVGAQMMKGKSGEVLWDDTIRLSIEIRKKLRGIAREFADRGGPDTWFFDSFTPDRVPYGPVGADGNPGIVPWENVPTEELANDPRYWDMGPDADWHGFANTQPGYAMTEPCKLTVLTPGFDRRTGTYAEWGIPAPLVAVYLRENRVWPEKNDLNSLLFLVTPGVESGMGGTLLSTLVAFKKLYDANARLDDIMPEFVAKRPQRYTGVRIKDLCQEMHAFYRDAGTAALQRKQFRPEHLPEPAMAPHAAVSELVRNNVDYLPIDQIDGRIATTLMLVYPPGIATVVPGERLGGRAQPMLDYFMVFERGSNLFPGLDNEIQGVYREKQPDGSTKFYAYVVRE